MMNKGSVVGNLAVVMVVVVVALAAVQQRAVAADCNPADLAVCLPAITGGSGNPTGECCNRLWKQEGCLCEYKKNPAFAPYVNSPNAFKVITACGIQPPTC